MKQPYSISGLVAVISLVFSVIWLSPAFATPEFVSLGQIATDEAPGALDLDEAGNLYVADALGGLVHKFSPFGKLLQSFPLQASGSGLAVTPDGKLLYVAQEESVLIYDTTGGEPAFLRGAESVGPEFGIAGEIDLDVDGNVYVVDASTLQVKVYDEFGQYRSRFGGIGAADGEFLKIGGMAVNPAGQVVVADADENNAKLHVITSNVSLTQFEAMTFANSGFGTPLMHAPRGLTFDAQGRGFVLDYMSAQVRVFSDSFVYQGAYRAAGYEEGQLSSVTDLVFDSVNRRLFVGCDNGRIEIFGVDGGSNPLQENKPPAVPTAQSPYGEVASVNPTLLVGNATDLDGDALSYVITVMQGINNVYEVTVPEQPGETTSVPVTVNLQENQAYSWTVLANDGEDSSAESTPAHFVVNVTDDPPTRPELLTLKNGESVDGAGLFAWSESSDSDPNDLLVTYRLEVALDELFAQLVTTQAVNGTTLALNALLDYGELADDSDYYWRVIALDDDLTASQPSLNGQFTYDTTGLTVTSNMPGAAVYFHGNHAYPGDLVGPTPLSLRDMEPGVFSVVVQRSGFEPYVAQVVLSENSNVDLYAELVPTLIVDGLNVQNQGVNGRSGLSVAGSAIPFVVDFDNDGDLDMLVGDESGLLTLFANLKKAGQNRFSFDAGVTLNLPSMPGAVPFVVDWNNDGRKDLLIGQADGFVTLFTNVGLEDIPAFDNGADLYAGSSALYVGSSAAPAVLDYNHDGAKDLLVGNADGQIAVYLNQGSDAAPLLSASAQILTVKGTVPFAVDWDADGVMELLVTDNGTLALYRKVEDVYSVMMRVKESKTTFSAAFPIDLDGSGKRLLAGNEQGELLYLASSNNKPVSAFYQALQDKLDELGELAIENQDDVAAIGVLLTAGDLEQVSLASANLAALLGDGPAQLSALELAALSNL